jgi:hypothetical protein
VLANRGDGFPVVVPSHIAGYDKTGRRFVAAPGLGPGGAPPRRPARHAYRAQLVVLSTRTFTGWREVSPYGAAGTDTSLIEPLPTLSVGTSEGRRPGPYDAFGFATEGAR